MTCTDCDNTAKRLREALRVLSKIAGTAEAAKQPDPAEYLQAMARKAVNDLEERQPHPSMAPTELPREV